MERIMHQLSDGSYVIVTKSTTTTLTIYHSPDKVTWTSRGTVVVDSFQAGERMYAVDIAANNDLHIAWINSTNVGRYVKCTYAAGTPTWTAGAQENGIATVAGGNAHKSPAIAVMDGGEIIMTCLRDPQTGSSDLTGRIRCRATGGTWGTEQSLTLSAGGPFTRLEIANHLARDAGGASGGVQKCWLMMCGSAEPFAAWTHRVIALTLSTGNFTLTTPPSPVSPNGATWWATVFSKGADRWWFAAYNAPSEQIYVAEASSTAVITTETMAVGGGVFSIPIDTTQPPTNKVTAFMLPDRILFAGLNDVSRGLGPPVVTLAGFTYSGGVFSDMGGVGGSYLDSITSGMTNVTDNTGVYILGGNDNRNQGGTEHLLVLFETATDKIFAHTVAAPTQTGTPTLTPAAGATVTTDLPTLTRSIAPTGTKVQWNLAEDAGFTVNAKTIDEPSSDYSSGTHSEVVPTASQLRQALWHMRSRLVDLIGQTSAYIATQTFTVAHVPSAAPTSPTGDVTKDYLAGTQTFDWAFSDTSPVDVQTAYQIIVERNSDGVSVVDTGKVLAAGVTFNAQGGTTAGRGTAAIGAGFKDVTLRWKVRVWDSDDVVSAYSSYGLFRVSDKPTVVVTAPAEAGTATSPAPQITWTFTASGGRTQASYRVVITRTSDAAVIYDSGTQAGSVLSHQIPTPVLVNTVAYSVAVTVNDSVGLSNTDSNAFTATWTPPAVPTGAAATAAPYEANGYNTISWTNTPRDADFFGWRIYRRVNGDTSSGELIFDTTTAGTNSFNDWTAQSGVAYQYNVVQVANRFGALVESNASWLAAITGTSTYYWLIHPDDDTKNFRLYLVVSDDYSEQYESETLNLIGRGRKVDYGTRYGYTGTLVCQVYNTPTLTARQAKAQIEAMKAELRELFLRNPFGDIWQVSLGDLAVSRIAGVGASEFVTLTIPYAEVT